MLVLLFCSPLANKGRKSSRGNSCPVVFLRTVQNVRNVNIQEYFWMASSDFSVLNSKNQISIGTNSFSL